MLFVLAAVRGSTKAIKQTGRQGAASAEKQQGKAMLRIAWHVKDRPATRGTEGCVNGQAKKADMRPSHGTTS